MFVWLFCISLRSFCIPLCSLFLSLGLLFICFWLFLFLRSLFVSFCGCFYLSEVIMDLYFGHCAALCGRFFCLLVFFFLIIWFLLAVSWKQYMLTVRHRSSGPAVLGLFLVGSFSNSSMIRRSYHHPSLPPLWPNLCWWTHPAAVSLIRSNDKVKGVNFQLDSMSG